MLRKLFLVLTLLMTFSLVFSSCKKKEPAEDDFVVNDECIFSPGTELTIVYNESLDYSVIEELFVQIYYLRGTYPTVTTNPGDYKHSIFIGEVDSPLSKKAYQRLDRLEKKEADDVGCVVNTDGYSIAIAYDEDICDSGIAISLAMEYINSSCLTHTTLISEAGTLYENVVGIVEYQTSIDEKNVEEMWDQFLTDLGEVAGESEATEIVASLKNCYKLFNDDVVYWLASLYDPNIGGFYYSNSGRDTVGYLPDLESTYQALSFLGGTGLGENLSVAKRIPDWMVKQIISFAKSLQDPESGYFYHPQWGGESFAERRAFIDGSFDSRKGRDLQWGVNILKNLGSAPTYDTPLGDKGDGILADGSSVQPASKALSDRFGKSVANAVSKVIFTNSEGTVPSHLRDVESLKNYLSKLDVKNDSYYVGNLLESQSKQIVARDKVLDKSGRTTPLADTVKAYFDNSQNPETGMWTVEEEITYEGVNGLLKISGVYNGIKKEFPNPIPALNSAMKGITIEEPPTTVCYVLNPWYAVTNIIDNVSNYNSSEDKNEVENAIKAVRAEILKNAVELIDVTTAKTSKFVKDDGSFSYFPTTSGPNSQGVPVAVTGSNEGDVNATYMFMSGIPNHIFGILGYNIIPVLTRADRYALWYALDDLGEIVKDEQEDPVAVDYEDEDVGSLPFGVTSSASSIGSSIGIVKTEGKNGKETRAVMLGTRSGGADIVRFPLENYGLFYNAVIFEVDLKFESLGGSGQIEMIPYGSSADAYRLIFDYAKDGNVTVRTINDFKSTYVAKEGEWFRLRFEYSYSDIDYDRNGTKDLLVKLYVNGSHIATGYTPASTNVLKEGNVSGVRFSSWTAANANLYIDNLLFMQGSVELDPAPVINEEDEAEKLTFEFSTPENIPGKVGVGDVSSSSEIVIVDLGGESGSDNVLGLNSSEGVYDKLKFYVTKPSSEIWNALSFTGEMAVNSRNGSFEMYFGSAYSAIGAKLLFSVENGEVYIYSTDINGNKSEKVKISESEAFFNIRLDVVSSTRSTLLKVYIGEDLVLTSNLAYEHSLNSVNLTTLNVYVKDTTSMSLYFDDVMLCQTTVLFDAEAEDEGIDFEDVTVGDISDEVVFEITETASIQIVSDLREGKLTNSLRLDSPKSSVDLLRFLLSEAHEETDTVVFETDIKISDADGDNLFNIYHKTADGRIANKLIFGYSTSTGSIFAQNQFVTNDGTGRDFSQVLLYEGVGDYFKLRIEYSKTSEKTISTKIFINGVELTFAESTTPYLSNAIDGAEISEIVFETVSNKKSSIFFDNVEIYYADYVTPPGEDPELPPVDPDLPPVWEEDEDNAFADDKLDNLDNNSWTK